MSDTKCHFAFNGLTVYDTIGLIEPCCLSKSGDPGTINTDIDSVINHHKIVELRRSMIAGEQHPSCKICWDIEKYGGRSMRYLSDTYYQSMHKKVPNFSERVRPEDMRHIDIFLGNKCNLACRMCGPHSSSLLNQQEKIINKSDKTPDKFLTKETEDNILNYIDQCKNITSIHLYGGEPLVIDFHDRLCEHLIANGRAKNTFLMLSTNLQIDVDRKMELHRHFKSLRIAVSVDGEGEIYEYIRWPGRWEKLLKNLLKLKEIHNNNPKFLDFGITTVVQNLNVDNLYRFITELENNKIITNEQIYYVEVREKNFIHMLPTYVIENALNKISNLPKNEGLTSMLLNGLERSKSLSNKEVYAFFDRQLHYDDIRNQNLFQTLPHFIDLADRYNIRRW